MECINVILSPTHVGGQFATTMVFGLIRDRGRMLELLL